MSDEFTPPMKAKDLIKVLEEGIEKFGEDVRVMFDTEARMYDYHMAVIGSAHAEKYPGPHIGLHEVRELLHQTPEEKAEHIKHIEEVLARTPDEVDESISTSNKMIEARLAKDMKQED